MLTITTLKWVPEMAQGYVRDLRLRWACEEAGLPYTLNLVDFAEKATPKYQKEEQPFGQVPTLQDGSLKIFESGSILLHLGEKSARLLPKDPQAKARATSWVFAAMNSVEPFVQFYNMCSPEDKVQSQIANVLNARLTSLNQWMTDRQYLENDEFTIGDMLMSCVLRELGDSGLLTKFPILEAYVQRCLSRPAFQKALADQMKTFAENTPAT